MVDVWCAKKLTRLWVENGRKRVQSHLTTGNKLANKSQAQEKTILNKLSKLILTKEGGRRRRKFLVPMKLNTWRATEKRTRIKGQVRSQSGRERRRFPQVCRCTSDKTRKSFGNFLVAGRRHKKFSFNNSKKYMRAFN